MHPSIDATAVSATYICIVIYRYKGCYMACESRQIYFARKGVLSTPGEHFRL